MVTYYTNFPAAALALAVKGGSIEEIHKAIEEHNVILDEIYKNGTPTAVTEYRAFDSLKENKDDNTTDCT